MSTPSLLLKRAPVTFALPREQCISLLGLACLIYFHTCGGAFGLEPLIGVAGPAWAVILILVTPIVWSLPAALMVAELTSLLPEEGGYYVWIRKAFGPFWAVQQACWTMACSMVWLAMYPVLFVSYLSFLIPSLSTSSSTAHLGMAVFSRWLLGVLVIALGMGLNLRGGRTVGHSAEVGAYFVVVVFAVLLLVWFTRGPTPSSFVDVIRSDLASTHKGVLLLGLSFLMFNYSGWENASTYAGEVDQPQRNYPRAIGVALLALILSYLLPVIAGVTVSTSPAMWDSETGWPVISQLIGGRWLGSLVAVAGLVSMLGLFNAQLLYVSRLPYVLARDGWLPKVFANNSHDAPIPKAAIFCFCLIAAIFVAFSFGSLAIIQCVLYVSMMTLDFLALIAFRVRQPHARRSFQIPGGWWGMGYVCIAPFAFAMLVLTATLRDWRSFPGQLLIVGIVAASAIVLYFCRRGVALGRTLGS